MRTINILLFIGLFLIMASCTGDKLPVYEDVSRVYFHWSTADKTSEDYHDNTKISLGYDNPVKSDSVIGVKVRLMGPLSDVDRPITGEVIQTESSAIAGKDIEILPSVMPAGKVIGLLLVKINNSDKLKTTTLMARIRLTPNEAFHVDFGVDGLEYNIYFDAKTDIPNLWIDPATSGQLTSYFGKYSNVKLNAICEACNLTRDFFMFNPATEKAIDVLNARIPTQIAIGMIAIVNRYLIAYKAAHGGQPLLDEYGNEVVTGLPSIY